MLHCIILGSCCLCIRNLTALTHSIPDNVNSSRVNTILHTLSMKLVSYMYLYSFAQNLLVEEVTMLLHGLYCM